jgi:hypothetical protein
VVVPIARNNPLLGATLADQSAFPREVLMEAVLRYVEQDLAAHGR